MELPKQYTVIYNKNGKNCYSFTNSEDTAFKWSIKLNGVIYIDTRYKAKLRLYWYLWRKKDLKTN